MGLPDMYFDLSPTYGPVNPGMDGLHDIMAEDDGRVTIGDIRALQAAFK